MRRIDPTHGLTAAVLAETVGGGLFLAASAIYFTTVVGLKASELGTALSIGAAVALVSSYPVARLADRAGSSAASPYCTAGAACACSRCRWSTGRYSSSPSARCSGWRRARTGRCFKPWPAASERPGSR